MASRLPGPGYDPLRGSLPLALLQACKPLPFVYAAYIPSPESSCQTQGAAPGSGTWLWTWSSLQVLLGDSGL